MHRHGMGNYLYLKNTLVPEFEKRLKKSGKHIYPSHVGLIFETVSGMNDISKNRQCFVSFTD